MRPATIIFEGPYGESKDGGGAPASWRVAESGPGNFPSDDEKNISDRFPVRSKVTENTELLQYFSELLRPQRCFSSRRNREAGSRNFRATARKYL